MDALQSLNSIGGNTLTGGFTPLPANIGLASNRLNLQTLAVPGGGDVNTLLRDNTAIQNLSVQMMQLLLTLMQGQGQQQQGGQGTNSSSTPSVDAASNTSSSGGTGGTGGSSSAAGTGASGPAPAADTKDKGEITNFIQQAAGVYGADPKVMVEVARRESNFQTGVVNDWDSNAKKGTPSKGLFQFIEPTFKSYAAEAKKAKPEAWAGLGELNWNDWRQQALAAAWAIANGKGSAWSTYKAAGGK